MKHTSPYLSAQALGITEAEHEALVWVYRSLKDGTIAAEQYHQGLEFGVLGCKTLACIGGWMAVYMGKEGPAEVVQYTQKYMTGERRKSLLGKLFWDRMSDTPISSGIQACLNALTLGDPCWDELPR